MRPGRSSKIILASLLLLNSPACERFRGAGSSGAAKAVSPTPAKVGDKSITAAEFQARLAEEPAFALPRYKSPERKKELLDGLIRSELLLQEARRRGLENDPEVRAAVEKVLINRLTRQYAQELDKSSPIPDAELQRYYDQHRSEFVFPTRVRVSHLLLGASQTKPLAEAARLLTAIKAREAKGEKQAFELTASQRSDDAATKATGGDLGFRTREDLATAWGAQFAEAALALKTQGEIAPPVSGDKGVHLLKLLGRHEGYETSFDSAKSRIASRLGAERQGRAIEDLVTDLKKKADIRIDEKALGQIDPAHH